MAIRRKSTPAIARMGQRSWDAGVNFLGSGLELERRKRNDIRNAAANLLKDYLALQNTPEYDEGGGATGAGIGAAIPLILAPFTGGASLAFLPAATAAGGAIGTAVDKPSGPDAAAASRQKQSAISMISPFIGGAAMGFQGMVNRPESTGAMGAFGEGFGSAWNTMQGGPEHVINGDPNILPSTRHNTGEIAAGSPFKSEMGPPIARGGQPTFGGRPPTIEQMLEMPPEMRERIWPGFNQAFEEAQRRGFVPGGGY